MAKAPAPIGTVAEIDAQLGDLYARHERGEAKLVAIHDERRALALHVIQDHKPAIARVALLNTQQQEVAAQTDTIADAIASLSEARRAAVAHEAAEAKEGRRDEAAAIAAALLETSAAVDAGMRELAALLARRAVLARDLIASGYGTGRLIGPGPIHRAAHAAGLARVFGMDGLHSENHRIALADSDRGLLPREILPATTEERVAA
jgi:hypothetical protein